MNLVKTPIKLAWFKKACLFTLFPLLALLFSSCTFKSVLYSHLDSAILWRIDDFFDTNSEQEAWLKPRISQLLTGVQKNQLLEVEAHLQKLIAHPGRLTPRQVEEDLLMYPRSLWLQLVKLTKDDTARLFRELSPEQLEHFGEEITEWREERDKIAFAPEKDYPSEFREYQEEGMERLGQWLGALNDQQRSSYLKLSYKDQQQFQAEVRLKQRIQRQFLDQIKQRRHQPQFATFLLAWQQAPGASEEDRRLYREFRQRRNARSLQITQTLESQLTQQQLEHRRQKLLELMEDIQTIKGKNYSDNLSGAQSLVGSSADGP